MLEIREDHPYFKEAFEFASFAVAHIAILLSKASTETIHELVNCVNTIVRSKEKISVRGQFNDHSIPPMIPLGHKRDNLAIVLHEMDALFGYLSGKNNTKPSRISYEVITTETNVGSAPSEAPDRATHTGSDPTTRFEFFTAYLIGGAYERRNAELRSKFPGTPENWPPQLQFFRHLRNGCFHGNFFDIRPIQYGKRRGQAQIDPSNPPAWQSYTMISDASLNGKKVINGFFPMAQAIPFLHDMGNAF